MGRLFTAANTDHLSVVSPAVTVKPLTLSCWYKPTTFTQQAALVALESNTTANRVFWVGVGTNATPIAVERGSAAATATHASTLTAGVWSHICGTFVSGGTGNRQIYLDGVAGTLSNANVATGPVPERIDLGGYFPTTVGTFASLTDGVLAYVAIWDVVLTQSKVTALSAGTPAPSIFPGNLKFYAPLLGSGSTAADYTAGQRHLAVTGASQAGNPKRAMPWPQFAVGLATQAQTPASVGGAARLPLLGVG